MLIPDTGRKYMIGTWCNKKIIKHATNYNVVKIYRHTQVTDTFRVCWYTDFRSILLDHITNAIHNVESLRVTKKDI